MVGSCPSRLMNQGTYQIRSRQLGTTVMLGLAAVGTLYFSNRQDSIHYNEMWVHAEMSVRAGHARFPPYKLYLHYRWSLCLKRVKGPDCNGLLRKI